MDGYIPTSFSMPLSRHPRRGFARRWLLLSRPAAAAVALAVAVLTHVTASSAQDEARVKAGLELWKTSGCADCHGAFADGEKDRDEAPTGANLRTSRLDAAGLKQTIGCGRPGADMPSFDEGAYTVRPCGGRPLGARAGQSVSGARQAQPRRDRYSGGLSAGTHHRARPNNAGRMPLLLLRRAELILRRPEIARTFRARSGHAASGASARRHI